MLDLKELREKKSEIEKKLQTKDSSVSLDPILALDTTHRAKLTELEQLKSERNKLSTQIGEMKRKGENTEALVAKVNSHAEAMRTLEVACAALETELHEKLASLPNIPLPEIKVSPDPKEQRLHQRSRSKTYLLIPL